MIECIEKEAGEEIHSTKKSGRSAASKKRGNLEEKKKDKRIKCHLTLEIQVREHGSGVSESSLRSASKSEQPLPLGESRATECASRSRRHEPDWGEGREIIFLLIGFKESEEGEKEKIESHTHLQRNEREIEACLT